MDPNNEQLDDELNQVIIASLKEYDENKDLEETILKSLLSNRNEEDNFEQAINISIQEHLNKLKREEDRLIREEQDREFAESLNKLLENNNDQNITNNNINNINNINDNINEVEQQIIEEDIKLNLDINKLREARLKYFEKSN